MSDHRQEQIRLRIIGLVDRGSHICAEFVPQSEIPVSCKRCGYTGEVHLLRDAIGLFAAKDAEIARLKEMFATEREDANQWLREEGIERKRADAAESQLTSLQAAIARVAQEMETAVDELRHRGGVSESMVLEWQSILAALTQRENPTEGSALTLAEATTDPPREQVEQKNEKTDAR